MIDKPSRSSHPSSVPRKLRIEYAGALYHVTNRGNRGEAIFADDEDRRQFLATLAAAGAKTGWSLHAFCLLPDHFHLVLETPQPNLVPGMKWFLSTYTNRFNRRHHTRGHLFAGRYRAVPLASDERYFIEACDHVHLNPARSGLVDAAQPLAAFPWSSFAHYLEPPSRRPGWLTIHRLLRAAQLADDADGRRTFEQNTEARRRNPHTQDWAPLRRGWCFGDRDFQNALLDRLTGDDGLIRHGAPPAELAARTGERIVSEELTRLGWAEADLAARPKAAPEKLDIAARLRRETVLSLRWIAARLQAGSHYTLRNALQTRVGPHAAATPPQRPLRQRSTPRLPAQTGAAPPPSEGPATTPVRATPSPPTPAPDPGLAAGPDGFSVAWD